MQNNLVHEGAKRGDFCSGTNERLSYLILSYLTIQVIVQRFAESKTYQLVVFQRLGRWLNSLAAGTVSKQEKGQMADAITLHVEDDSDSGPPVALMGIEAAPCTAAAAFDCYYDAKSLYDLHYLTGLHLPMCSGIS